MDALPVNTSVFEGVDDANNRQVNVHCPGVMVSYIGIVETMVQDMTD
ncbi:MAG: hypothetical protein R2769_02215 [Saprospiraceae bacterium]